MRFLIKNVVKKKLKKGVWKFEKLNNFGKMQKKQQQLITQTFCHFNFKLKFFSVTFKLLARKRNFFSGLVAFFLISTRLQQVLIQLYPEIWKPRNVRWVLPRKPLRNDTCEDERCFWKKCVSVLITWSQFSDGPFSIKSTTREQEWKYFAMAVKTISKEHWEVGFGVYQKLTYLQYYLVINEFSSNYGCRANLLLAPDKQGANQGSLGFCPWTTQQESNPEPLCSEACGLPLCNNHCLKLLG